MYDYKCDVKLQIGKETFRAHRDVLAEASDYFDAMFSHDMREKEQQAIEFHEISPRGFTSMLEYFYHGHLTIDPDNIEDILEVARFFMIEWLVHVCCDFLVRHLCLDNYHNVLHLADKYVLGDLRYDIFRFIGQNYVSLAETPKFLYLSFELFHLMLSEDYFIHAPEYFIFESLMRWLRHEENRKQYKLELLRLIRFPLFDETQLLHLPEDAVDLPEIAQLVAEAIEYQQNPSKQCIMSNISTEARGGQEVLMLVSAVEDAHLIQYKIPGTPGFYSEEINSSFLQSVFEFTHTAALGNFVFVAGGYNRHSWCSAADVYRYNPRNHSWAEVCPMNVARVSFALCTSAKGLYAVAGINHIVETGSDKEDILASVEYYDPMSGQWRFIPDLPIGCFSVAAGVSGETLYVSGGITDDPEDEVPVAHMRRYTPGDDHFTDCSPMLVARQGHSMIAHHDKVYVHGGHTAGLDTMSFLACLENEVYDPEMNQWTKLSPTPDVIGHIHSSSCEFHGILYFLTGKGPDRTLLDIMIKENGEQEMGEGEMCGQYVQKLLPIRVAFPFDVE